MNRSTSSRLQHAKAVADDAADSAQIGWLARAGLAARATVYTVIGVLALLAAVRSSGRDVDQQGALAELLTQPWGTALVALLTVGFVGYAVWRLSEAAFGVTGEPDGAGPRLKSAFRGVVYLSLTVSAVAALRGSARSQSGAQTSLTAEVMSYSGGRVLVGLVGLAIMAGGAALVVEGYQLRFLRFFRAVPPQVHRVIVHLGRLGTIGRGVVFVLVGSSWSPRRGPSTRRRPVAWTPPSGPCSRSPTARPWASPRRWRCWRSGCTATPRRAGAGCEARRVRAVHRELPGPRHDVSVSATADRLDSVTRPGSHLATRTWQGCPPRTLILQLPAHIVPICKDSPCEVPQCDKEFGMARKATMRRSIAVLAISGSLLAGGIAVATQSQAATRVGMVELSKAYGDPPNASTAADALADCRKKFGTVTRARLIRWYYSGGEFPTTVYEYRCWRA